MTIIFICSVSLQCDCYLPALQTIFFILSLPLILTQSVCADTVHAHCMGACLAKYVSNHDGCGGDGSGGCGCFLLLLLLLVLGFFWGGTS